MARKNDGSMIVHREWARRPADERFLSLMDMRTIAKKMRALSAAGTVKTHDLEVVPKGDDLVLASGSGEFGLNNWSARQLGSLSGVPLDFVSAQPADLAARNFNWGLRSRDSEEVSLLVTAAHKDGPWTARAMNGPRYGRIWNDEVLDALIEKFGDGVTGEWRVPGIRGKALDKVTIENTTLFMGDRDFFVFLANESDRVEVKARRDGKPGSLARGFYISNSETGAGKLRIGMYLYDFLCANRIIWGIEEFIEIAIRHSSLAPWRWVQEAAPQIEKFAQASAKPMEAKIKAAQQHLLGSPDEVTAFLNRRFTPSQTINMQRVHVEEEGRPVVSRWDAVTAATAYAKAIPYQNERFAVEAKAGELLTA